MNDLGVRRLPGTRVDVAPQVVPIEQINSTLLARANQQMGVRGAADRIRQHHGAAGAEIVVHGIERGLIKRREVVSHDQQIVRSSVGGGDFDETVTQTVRGLAGIIREERPVSRLKIDIAVGVRGRSGAGLPDAAQPAVGTRVIDSNLLQRLRVIAEQPAMIRTVVAVRSVSDVNHAVEQQQTGTVHLAQIVERHVAGHAAVPGSVDRCLNAHRAAKFLRAARNVQGVEPVPIRAALFGFDFEVNRIAVGVDDRRAGNADFRNNVA